MRNDPTREEMIERILSADDWACNGGYQDSDCRFCQHVAEVLRGGSIYCPECGHINAIGHDCDDWDCERGTMHETWAELEPRRYCEFVGTRKREGGNFFPLVTSNPVRVWVSEKEN